MVIDSTTSRSNPSGDKIVHRTACNRDCPDACEVLVTIDDGRMTRLQGSKSHPITRGFLCERTSGFLDRQYAPDRLTTPLKRVADAFQPITWDQALDEIAAQMLRFRSESGPSSILNYRCGGSLGLMKHVTDYFFRVFGPVTEKSGDVCSGAGEAAQVADFGASDSNDLLDLLNSRTIVLWGKNVYCSNVHLLPILREAKERGAKLVLIDPVPHRTASLCDLVLQPRPGGDAALACGVARWLQENHAIDEQANAYCEHWDEYWQLVFSQSLEAWAAAADVTCEALKRFATIYAQGPSAILVGWGMQRRRFGAATVRAVDALATVSGNMGIAGGGASFYFRRRGAFELSFVERLTPARTIPEPLLGPGILAQQDPPIRMAWISAANPVATLPDSQVVAEALGSRELTVVVDSFLTDTARCAHYVLPTTSFLEEDDLLGAYGHHWLSDMTAAAKPWGESRSDYDILRSLAPRLKMTNEEFTWDVSQWKAHLLRRVASLGVTPERLAEGAVRNPLATDILFANRQFATASGKANLVTALPVALMRAADATPPLTLSALSTARAQSSQWLASEQSDLALVRLHPSVVPNGKDGDEAELRSERGVLRVRLQLDEKMRPDMVVMDKGGWLYRGRCANALITAELTDDGEGAVYYDTPVSVRVLGR